MHHSIAPCLILKKSHEFVNHFSQKYRFKIMSTAFFKIISVNFVLYPLHLKSNSVPFDSSLPNLKPLKTIDQRLRFHWSKRVR